MRTVCFVPIKAYSERVKGKNLRPLNGKPLYNYILESIRQSNAFDDVYVDTNSEEVVEFSEALGFKTIPKKEELAQNSANGNDLLNYHYSLFPNYDFYFQLFATAPFLKASTISKCVECLVNSNEHDSIFTATKNNSFYWMNNLPVNYRPGILPRSQDMTPLIEESTGLYGISSESLKKYGCRIGKRPYIFIIDKFEATDINTEDDFLLAELIQKIIVAK